MTKKTNVLSLIVFILAAFALVPAALAQDETPEPGGLGPGFGGRGGFVGTGISAAYDATGGRFLIGAPTGGAILTLSETGETATLIDDEAIQTARALYVNPATNTLYVLSGNGFGGFGGFAGGELPEGVPPFDGTPPADFTPPAAPEGENQPGAGPGQGFPGGGFGGEQTITLLAYDLTTLARTMQVDLTEVAPEGPRGASDLTQDAQGNVYITDAQAGVVYLVDASGNAYYLQNALFASEEIGGGLSAIVYHPDGFLIVANAATGALLRIPLDDAQNVTEIVLAEPLTSLSDLALDANGDLIALNTTLMTAVRLSSTDGWNSAAVAAQVTLETRPLGLIAGPDGLYLLGANVQSGSDQPALTFTLTRLALG